MRLIPTEAETQKAILELLAAYRVYAFRLNTAAIKTEGRFFRAHSAGAGAADIFALPVIHTTYWQGSPCGHELTIGQPQPLWVEVKSPTGRQTREQHSFQTEVESRGCYYLLARSVDDVSTWLKQHRVI